ncbi:MULTISPECIES: CdaR family transcriptional regulator [Streptacidiphilus]|uniref:PucR family transcriptional regulator n=1 Tax=Streptacidiphilus cavernicola TaxID=3342716 RepID=A0ABV6UI70_9ACTN|nr:helix-turn-helix domain-containing protein [Streptacidiphilus jeojiense]
MNGSDDGLDAARGWPRSLRPTRAGAGLGPASGAAVLAEATSAVGPGAVAWAVEVGHDMATAVIAAVPELGGGEGPFETLRMGTESVALRALVTLVADGATSPLTDEALLGDRDFVRRGVPLDKVLRGIHLGHAAMARAFMAACEATVAEADRSAQMKRVSETLFEFIDGFSSGMAEEYLAERDRWVTSSAAAREETVRSILEQSPVDIGTASRTLDYDLRREHLALTAWCHPATGAEASELQRAAVEFLRARRCITTLVVPIGRTGLWAWGARTAQGNAAANPAASPAEDPVADVAADPEGHPSVQMACGSPASGLDGFRRSHEEAVLAERTARLSSRPRSGVTHYRDVELASLLTGDLDRARRFVQRELGPLADDTPHAEELRETLRHYLQAERSLLKAAARMHVARNTVTYRVKRAEQLLGHGVADRHLEVQAALTVAHVVGSAVLREEPANPRRR